MKIADRVLVKKAKDNGRANRDEEMDFFAVYYKEQFSGSKYSAFKKHVDHPWKI